MIRETADSAALTNNMSRKIYDAVIIGGGASGLAAATELGLDAPSLDVLIIEKNDSIGRKVRATGSGRCNITNTGADGYNEIMAFFRRIGLVTREYPNGLVYPYSESAADVVSLFEERLASLGTEILNGAQVTEISKTDDLFCVKHEKKSDGITGEYEVYARNVILAVGGKAGPTYGTVGDGYALARSLGHSIVTPVPVLTGIECAEWKPGAELSAMKLAGTRSRGKVSLYDGDKMTFEETGEIQFTKYGLSGICVFNMTRFMRYNRAAGESLGKFTVNIDLIPEGDIAEFLRDRAENDTGCAVRNILCTVLKENVAEYILERAESEEVNISGNAGSLSENDMEKLACIIHQLSFKPTSVRGWKDAQATSGGVSVDEVEYATCESKLCRGLYITGELLDRDYPCGGYNLSNAWLTGIKAAGAIASR